MVTFAAGSSSVTRYRPWEPLRPRVILFPSAHIPISVHRQCLVHCVRLDRQRIDYTAAFHRSLGRSIALQRLPRQHGDGNHTRRVRSPHMHLVYAPHGESSGHVASLNMGHGTHPHSDVAVHETGLGHGLATDPRLSSRGSYPTACELSDWQLSDLLRALLSSVRSIASLVTWRLGRLLDGSSHGVGC
jgi:hypothetical protein